MAALAARIPLVDIGWQTDQIREEVWEGFDAVVRRSAFILGEEVEAFESEFAAYCEAGHCVGVANGTDALELALRAVSVGSGDEVILPANSFVASASAVVRAGATPVLADVNPVTHLIDVQSCAARVGPRTRAIMPVHLFGQMAPMAEITELAASVDAAVVEDAAQAQGASQERRRLGGGHIAATSFYPGKNLGAFGDGGAVLAGSAESARRLRLLRNHGSSVKYEHAESGFNSRLDTLQAVVLSAKLRHLDQWNDQRREAADLYDDLLRGVDDVQRPVTAPGNIHVWHLYVVSVPRRDEVLRRLHQEGIEAGVHYPVPIHLQGAFRHLGHRPGDFPVSEAAASSILSLPLYPGITPAQQERVVATLREALLTP